MTVPESLLTVFSGVVTAAICAIAKLLFKFEHRMTRVETRLEIESD
jgi:hypothetical protein